MNRKLVFAALIALLALMLCAGAQAEDFEITSKGEITDYTGSASELVIPDTINGIMVRAIGNEAFKDCSSLTSVTIPDGVTSIGTSAFNGCSNLTSVTIPVGVSTIGYKAFYKCGSLTSVTIPDGVTSISVSAFEDCCNLTRVTIPDSVTYIGHYAFSGCSSLTSVTIPDSVTTIGNSAFRNCTGLMSVPIPDSVTSIGSSAFYNCSSLTSVPIPDSVTSIGDSAFFGCISLTSVYATDVESWLGISFSSSTSNPMYHATDLYFKGELVINITIPDRVTTISDYAFYNCISLKNVMIPDSVTTIGDSAFEDCNSLTSVAIPDSVTTIGNSAFNGCSGLTDVTIPDSVISVGYSAFRGCSSLTSVTIPDSVTSIGNYAFYSCDSLTGVTIPDSVTSIGDQAFSRCFDLTNLVMPGEDMPELGTDVFYKCTPTVYCYEYTGVDLWAYSNGYKTVYLDNVTLPLSLTLPADCTLAVGGTRTVVADVFPAEKDARIEWTSSCPDVASVENGVLTARAPGVTIITARYGDLSDSMTVTTFAAVESFDVSDLWLVSKTTAQLSVRNIRPEGAIGVFSYASSDDTVFTVDGSGLVSGLKPGEATLTVTTNNGISRACTVHVCYPVTAIEFEKPEMKLVSGRSAQLTANVATRSQSYVNKLVSFASSDESVLTVDENGLATGVSTGTATVTATAGSGVTAQCTVTVYGGGTLVLPADLTAVGPEAFRNVSADTVVIPDGCLSIGSRAFADCAGLRMISVPESVTDIADDAFENCTNLTICAPAGSRAESWADAMKIPFIAE